MALQDKYINPFPDIGFKKLFDAAEIARFKPEEKQQYIAGLKYYRDLSNVIDTSYDDGIAKGSVEGIEKAIIDTIIKGHQNGLPIETLSRITGKSRQKITQILKNILE